ncbi:hypothetical protein MLD38_017656 [Melastoma candidum]|uniref:Uncharacterized protein n=1 Tax=Melastoma candidum TaxID=119954 RepID=A0ACB9QRH4_9MYRT|nr:hypothetical protein MLD38_017656 [Melastoma candidum]
MDTSSTASMSSHSEGEAERDSTYGSCDSEEVDPRYSGLREFHRNRSYGDQSKFKKILLKLTEETDPSSQVTVLTELCEGLSFCVEDSLSSMLSDSFSPILVRLARHDDNPDIMLLAVRAITYLCDVFPRSAAFLVRHDAVPTLCKKLTAIEYLDVAEQCLQALEKISRDQPLACLQAGAILAVLNYIDFFSTSLQRVAISTVANICKKLPSDSPSPFMEAVPILCNLLQYEDRQLVESVALCLIKITERVSQTPENLEDLCKHGMIHQATQLIQLCGKSTLSVPVYNGMIGLLVKLCSGSYTAFKNLHELNICNILKDIITTHELSRTMSSSHLSDGHCLQVQEILKLLNALLPALSKTEKLQILSEKEAFLFTNSDLVRMSTITLVPLLMQMVDSGANTYICYGCLSVINNMFYLSTSDILGEVVKDSNISRFLAGVFTRKDQHVLDVALQIAESCLQKLPNTCLNSFMKEGVFFSIDALLTPEKGSHVLSSGGNLLSPDSSQKKGTAEGKKCLCFAFEITLGTSHPETGSCKLSENAVYNRAKHMMSNFFPPELNHGDEVLTDILQKLRAISLAFNDLTSMPVGESPLQDEEKFYALLWNVIATLDGKESVSTFEFIKSGIVRSLLNYLSNGLTTRESIVPDCASSHLSIIEKRFSVFTKLMFSKSDAVCEDLPIVMLIRKLHSALSSLENFPVVTSPLTKQRNCFASIPEGICVPYPCLKVRLIKAEGDECLRDYSKSVVTVDPLSSLDTFGNFLYPFVMKKSESSSTVAMHETENRPTQSAVDPVLRHEKSPGVVNELLSISSMPLEIQVSQLKAPEVEMKLPLDHPVSSHDEDYLAKLLFSLDGREIDQSMTLYQAIILRQMEVESEMIAGSKLWSQVYTLTYRRARKPSHDNTPNIVSSSSDLVLSPKHGIIWCIFASKLVSELESSSPVYEIMLLLRCLEAMNRQSFQLVLDEKGSTLGEGSLDGLECMRVVSPSVPKSDFVNVKLTEKLEQQMRDSLAVSTGGIPSWCNELMNSCPFLFSFEARCKYYRLAAFGRPLGRDDSPGRSSSSRERYRTSGGYFKKKFVVHRDRIMDSAVKMMDIHGDKKVPLEVEFDDEVGTGLGPTLEFFTLVSHEFQKPGLGLWREDHNSSARGTNLDNENLNIVFSSLGLFPRPWPASLEISDSAEFSEVLKRFTLLGKVVAKALQDGRVMDLHLSKAFYKVFLGQDLDFNDIWSFDPQLGRTLAEFQSLVDRKRALESVCGMDSNLDNNLCFRGSKIEDLCLEFTVPGFPDYVLPISCDCKMVDMTNLEDYVSLIVNATIKSGIQRQVEAFRSGFDQIFPSKHLQIFSENEMERLLCGEHDAWVFNELLDHIKFDHGYTGSSPPVINFLEIIQEFDREQQRLFLQFVTGAPRLPPGGFPSLNPKLTVVRKLCGNSPDAELPSVMTCANYLKLPPYSTKEKMEEKMLYAMKEGQGAFHLS